MYNTHVIYYEDAAKRTREQVFISAPVAESFMELYENTKNGAMIKVPELGFMQKNLVKAIQVRPKQKGREKQESAPTRWDAKKPTKEQWKHIVTYVYHAFAYARGCTDSAKMGICMNVWNLRKEEMVREYYEHCRENGLKIF